MKNDRFLNGMIAGIGMLILIALVLFFVRQNQADYLPDDTPNGVVNNYILSIIEKDYDRAYSYLVDNTQKPQQIFFQQELSRMANDINQISITVGEVFIEGQTATVQLSLRQPYERPFNNIGRYNEVAQLQKENGAWKIISMPYPLWSWNWYTEVIKPVP